MLARIPFSLFMEWLAYRALHPFGEERADWRSAVMTAELIGYHRNANRGKGQAPKRTEAKTYLLVFDSERPEPVKLAPGDLKKKFFAVMLRQAEALKQQQQRREERKKLRERREQQRRQRQQPR